MGLAINKSATYNINGREKTIIRESSMSGKVTFKDLEHVKLAKVINENQYPQINPSLGTIGFFLKKLRLKPEDIISIINHDKLDSRTKNDRALLHLIDIWNHLDNHSRERFDLFDHLARRGGFTVKQLWGLIMVKISNYSMQSIETANILLRLGKLDIASTILEKAKDNDKVLNLAAQATGLVKNETHINVETNIANVTNNRPTFDKLSSIVNKEIANEIDNINIRDNRLLTEGNVNDNYIDADYSMDADKELA